MAAFLEGENLLIEAEQRMLSLRENESEIFSQRQGMRITKAPIQPVSQFQPEE